MITEKQDLQSKLYVIEEAVSKLETNIAEYEKTVQEKDSAAKRMVAEIEAKSEALQEKDVTISAMSEQLTKARDHLTINKQVSTCITIKVSVTMLF